MPKTRDMNIENEFLRVLVFGKYNTGKSVFASSFPTPGKLFDLDLGAITYKDSGGDWDYEQYFVTESPSVTYSRLMKNLIQFRKEVCSPNSPWKTCAFDSLTLLIQLATALAVEKYPISIGEKLDWKIHYAVIKDLVAPILAILFGLPINLIVIGHVTEIEDSKTKITTVYPAVTGQLRHILPAMFSDVWFAKKTKLLSGQKYELQTRVEGIYDARSRLSGVNNRLPLFVPNNYTKIMEIIKNATEKEKK